ncbi:MAG: hypothetical protein ACOCRX_10480, partial [Candidatus Woesearchaeota archaeon]
ADSDSGEYKVFFTPDSSGEGYLSFEIIGEDRVDPAPVNKAYINDNKSIDIETEDGKVGPIKFKKEFRESLKLELNDRNRYALGVSAVED